MQTTFYVSSLGDQAIYLQTIRQQLKAVMNKPMTLIFVPSSKVEYPTRKEFEQDFVYQLKEMAIELKKVISLNPDSSKKEFKQAFEQAGFIYLHGGNPLQFMDFLKDRKVRKFLKNYQGIVMGLSAGAMLMSEHIVLTPTNDEYQDFVVQKAFGYQKVNIFPHMNFGKVVYSTFMTGDGKVVLEDLLKLSQEVEIQLLGDGNFIVNDEKVGNDFYLLKKGKVYRYHENKYQPINFDARYLNLVDQKDAIVIKTIFDSMDEAVSKGYLNLLCHANSHDVIQPLTLSLLKLEEQGTLYQQTNFSNLKTWVLNNPQLRYGTLVLEEFNGKIRETLTIRTRYLKLIEDKIIIEKLASLE